MANTFITPEIVATQALASLYNTTVMLPLVYSDVSSDFGPQKVGNTVNIRKPAVFTANDFNRANGITIQNATEGDIPVVLNDIADVSFAVTAEDMTLSIEDFDEQLLTPAMEAISQAIDVKLLGLRSDITAEVGTIVSGDPLHAHAWSDPGVLIDAGAILNLAAVPTLNRNAVIGPVTNAKWQDDPALRNAAAAGDTDALRNASVGRILSGFAPYWTQNVGQPKSTGSQVAGDPTTEVGVAFHQTAFAFASAPLETPPGSNAVIQNYKGLSIRIVSQYDIKYKQTIFSLDTLFGVKTLDPNRAVLLKGADHA
jgi:hypothetical protein